MSQRIIDFSINDPLPKGKRYLTVDDFWQNGDQYNGGWGWWTVGTKETGVRAGRLIDIGFICYKPRGSVKRRRVK